MTCTPASTRCLRLVRTRPHGSKEDTALSNAHVGRIFVHAGRLAREASASSVEGRGDPRAGKLGDHEAAPTALREETRDSAFAPLDPAFDWTPDQIDLAVVA